MGRRWWQGTYYFLFDGGQKMEMAARSAVVIVILMWAWDRSMWDITLRLLCVSQGIFLWSVILVLCCTLTCVQCVNTPLIVCICVRVLAENQNVFSFGTYLKMYHLCFDCWFVSQKIYKHLLLKCCILEEMISTDLSFFRSTNCITLVQAVKKEPWYQTGSF